MHRNLTLKKKIGLGATLVGLVLIAVTLVFWWRRASQILSPITDSTTFRFLIGEPPTSSGKVVYGFLPYWNLNKTTIQPELTHLSYFGIELNGDGTVRTVVDGGGEPGLNKLDSDELAQLIEKTKEHQGKFEITLIQFNNDDIVQLVTTEKARQNTLTTIDNLILAYPVSGINIDIEYNGPITDSLRKEMAEYVATISDHVHSRYQGVDVSIDMYASAASQQNIWDVQKIGQSVDYIVIMAYDFHRRSSIVAGPVAPLFGGKKLWDSDISQHLKAFAQVVPREKLLLGIPFYGYEWQTTSRNSQAHTFPDTGSTASFQRVQELMKNKDKLKLREHWNEQALSPYISYEENGELYVIYYENSRSISYKLDYVNQLELGGIAIWALGYEGDSRELWDVIERKL